MAGSEALGRGEPPLLGSEPSIDQERSQGTALRTLYCSLGARVMFLFSHGVLVVSVSTSLQYWPDIEWTLVFLPAWIGNSLCIALLIACWFVSCPYVKLCLAEKQPRVGLANPSILTEVLPDIVLSIFGVVFLSLTIISEYALCRNLDGAKQGDVRASPSVVVLFTIIALLSVCHGTCTTYSSLLFICVGAGLLLTVVTVAFTCRAHNQTIQALGLAPPILTVGCLLAAALHRQSAVRHVLNRAERQLHWLEVFFLASLLIGLLCVGVRVALGGYTKVQVEGSFVGAVMCILAVVRIWIAHLEVRLSTVGERLLTAAPSARTVRLSSPSLSPAEVQISIRTDSDISGAPGGSGRG